MTISLHQAVNMLHSTSQSVLCLTNYATMDFTANALLAVRANPLISESLAEIEEMMELSQALYINTGSINLEFMKLALFAADKANSKKIPVILEPVGAGTSFIRTSSAKELLHLADVVRANPYEILALGGITNINKDLGFSDTVKEAIEIAELLAKNYNKIISLNGPSDYISNGINHHSLNFGAPIMASVNGMGSALTAIIAAFVASNQNHYQALIDATTYFGLCAQLTSTITSGPGSFKPLFLDTLYAPDWSALASLYHA